MQNIVYTYENINISTGESEPRPWRSPLPVDYKEDNNPSILQGCNGEVRCDELYIICGCRVSFGCEELCLELYGVGPETQNGAVRAVRI